MGGFGTKREIIRRKKYLTKETKAYILVSCVIYGGLMFHIFHAYPLNDLMMDKQLSVDLG